MILSYAFPQKDLHLLGLIRIRTPSSFLYATWSLEGGTLVVPWWELTSTVQLWDLEKGVTLTMIIIGIHSNFIAYLNIFKSTHES